MRTRTQQLVFLTIWAAACVAGVIIALALGLGGDGSRGVRATFFIISIVALMPAAAGYALVRRCSSMIDSWRVRRGHDIYTERAYEDDGGFIHLNVVPDSMKPYDIGVTEMLKDVGPAITEAFDDSNESS